MNFQHKLALVTGGSSGIGLSISLALAKHGTSVVITGRNQKNLQEAAQHHERLTGIPCDVTQENEVVDLRKRLDEMGGVDILINNAGVMHFFNVKEGFPLSRQVEEIEIDSVGPVRVIHHFLPGLLERDSVVVNVSSGLAFVPFALAPVYSACKAFLHAYTRCLRSQLADTSVRVVELLPPVVDTPLATSLDPSWPRMPPDELAQALITGLKRGVDEITPGQSWQLKWAARIIPNFIFAQMNKPRKVSS